MKVSQYLRKREYPELFKIPLENKNNYNKNSVFRIIEEQPEFPGGTGNLGPFIGLFLQYPEEAKTNGISGDVVIQFTIRKDGSMDDFEVINGLGHGCDKEAIRVLGLLPDWKPGYQHGKPVEVKRSITIAF